METVGTADKAGLHDERNYLSDERLEGESRQAVMAVPQNAQAIWNYLTSAGLSDNATAGVLGNIEQESGGSTSAGSMSNGYGLIQWTPGTAYASEGIDSGNQLDNQLKAIITYINSNGSIAKLNANSTSPTAAALYFSDVYERPAPATANNSNREQSATQVAQAASSGKWPTNTNAINAINNETNTLGGVVNAVTNPAGTIVTDVLKALGIGNPIDALERGGLMIAGAIAVLMGLKMFVSGKVPSAPSGAPQKAEKASDVADVAEVAAA